MKTVDKIKEIFNLYYSNKISREQRKDELNNFVGIENFNDAISSLVNNGTLETTRNVIMTGFMLNFYNEQNEQPMRELLLLNFHDSHEDITSLFQSMFNNNIENIFVLLQALENIPKYLQPEDFKYPYVRKIIYAIGAQPQPESLLALEKLALETDDEEIKKLTLHQLEKRKRLGRWEAEGR